MKLMFSRKYSLALFALFLTFSYSGNAETIFHVIKGEVCTGVQNCPESTGTTQCISSQGSNELISAEGGNLIPLADSTVGYQNRLGQIVYEKLKQCGVYPVDSFGGTLENPTTLLSMVKDFLSGQRRTAQAVKRNKEVLQSLPSMPFGYIMKPKTALTLTLLELEGEQFVVVTMTSDNAGQAPISLSTQGSLPQLTLEPAILEPGKYDWQIETESGVYAGVFSVLAQEDQAMVESDLKEKLPLTSEGISALMTESGIYQYYGLTFDRNRVFEKVRSLRQEEK